MNGKHRHDDWIDLFGLASGLGNRYGSVSNGESGMGMPDQGERQ